MTRLLTIVALLAAPASVRALAASAKSMRSAARELATVGGDVRLAGESIINFARAAGDVRFRQTTLSASGLNLARAGRDLEDAGAAGRVSPGIAGEVAAMRIGDAALNLGLASEWPCDGPGECDAPRVTAGLAFASAELEKASQAFYTRDLELAGARLTGCGEGLETAATAIEGAGGAAMEISTAARSLASGGALMRQLGGFFSGDLDEGDLTKKKTRWSPN
jgi:hypothetical protein